MLWWRAATLRTCSGDLGYRQSVEGILDERTELRKHQSGRLNLTVNVLELVQSGGAASKRKRHPELVRTLSIHDWNPNNMLDRIVRN